MAGYKPSYTVNEEKDILRFILDHKAFYMIRGTVLWKQMEPKFSRRTWQSLKNRFFKSIVHNLNNPDYGLNPVEIKKMQLALLQTSTSPKVEHSKKSKNDSDVFDMPDCITHSSDSDE